jgi:hypothetical protein
MQFCSVTDRTYHIVYLVTVTFILVVYKNLHPSKLMCVAPSAFIAHQRYLNQTIKFSCWRFHDIYVVATF